MSTPSNPSSIMIYKIMNDLEKTGRRVQSLNGLKYFAEKVLKFANTLDDEEYWMLETPEIKEDLERICDLTNSFCEVNEEKLKNGGEEFAKIKMGLMPYSWLKATLATLMEIEEKQKKSDSQTSKSNNQNEDKKPKIVFWGKGKSEHSQEIEFDK